MHGADAQPLRLHRHPLQPLRAATPRWRSMAAEMAKRDTRLEPWDRDDPNRRMQLEETPWLAASKGGKESRGGPGQGARSEDRPGHARGSAGQAAQKAQTSLGGFPWWPGGPPSPVHDALHRSTGSPRRASSASTSRRRWSRRPSPTCTATTSTSGSRDSIKCDCGWEFVTFLSYVLTSYPDDSLDGRGLHRGRAPRRCSTSRSSTGRTHSPYLKGYLALTLQRRGRPRGRAAWSGTA